MTENPERIVKSIESPLGATTVQVALPAVQLEFVSIRGCYLSEV